MRILLLSDELNDSSMGGPKVALKLQAGLVGLGHACDVLFRPELGSRPRNVRLRLAVSPGLARRAVVRARREHGPYDVVDAASAEGWLIPPSLGAGGARAALVARSHGLEHAYYRELLADARAGLLRKPWTHRLWYPLARLTQVAAALRRADRVILLNQRDRRFVIERGWQPPDRIEIIPHGVDHDRWRNAPAPEAIRGAGILFCGWWTTSKGVHYLAQAHALLLRQGIAAPLTLLGVGTGETQVAMEARVRGSFAAASQPLLRILARTHEDAVFAEYRRHDLLVCPSTSEGFGLVVVEALSQRLPVVCCHGAGAADWLGGGREGLREGIIVPPRDPEALAAAVARLWQNPGLRREMGEAGHQRMRGLDWTAVAVRTVACYEAALAAHGKARHNAGHA